MSIRYRYRVCSFIRGIERFDIYAKCFWNISKKFKTGDNIWKMSVGDNIEGRLLFRSNSEKWRFSYLKWGRLFPLLLLESWKNLNGVQMLKNLQDCVWKIYCSFSIANSYSFSPPIVSLTLVKMTTSIIVSHKKKGLQISYDKI